MAYGSQAFLSTTWRGLKLHLLKFTLRKLFQVPGVLYRPSFAILSHHCRCLICSPHFNILSENGTHSNLLPFAKTKYASNDLLGLSWWHPRGGVRRCYYSLDKFKYVCSRKKFLLLKCSKHTQASSWVCLSVGRG